MSPSAAPSPDKASFALVLEPADGAARRLAGLPLALRLALDAQAAGASCVVVPADAAELRAALVDSRLRIPVVTEAPSELPRLRARANMLVHRGSLRELGLSVAAGTERAVAELSEPPSVAYAFAPVEVTSDA